MTKYTCIHGNLFILYEDINEHVIMSLVNNTQAEILKNRLVTVVIQHIIKIKDAFCWKIIMFQLFNVQYENLSVKKLDTN